MSTTIALIIVGFLWLAAAVILIAHWLRAPKNRVVLRLAGFKWTRGDFCRGWLITGDTGSGKTRSGITPLLFQIFQNEPTWGGLCIDDKGLYWETLSQMARHFGREDDLILLQVRPDDAGSSWQPRHTYNLTADRSIPYNTFAKAVVDTACHHLLDWLQKEFAVHLNEVLGDPFNFDQSSARYSVETDRVS